jgi:hypothetical protein
VTNVLIVATAIPAEPTILLEALAKLRDRGAEVAIACFFPAEDLPVDESLAQQHSFAQPDETIGARFRKALKNAKPQRRTWMFARRDGWLRQQARRADVLVAMDPASVHTVWEFAQRHPTSDAVYGLIPALKVIDRRSTATPVPTAVVLRRRATAVASIGARNTRTFGIRATKGMLRRATGRRVMRTAPGAWGSPCGSTAAW